MIRVDLVRFTASSGNRGQMQKISETSSAIAMRTSWERSPSEADIQECDDFFGKLTNATLVESNVVHSDEELSAAIKAAEDELNEGSSLPNVSEAAKNQQSGELKLISGNIFRWTQTRVEGRGALAGGFESTPSDTDLAEAKAHMADILPTGAVIFDSHRGGREEMIRIAAEHLSGKLGKRKGDE